MTAAAVRRHGKLAAACADAGCLSGRGFGKGVDGVGKVNVPDGVKRGKGRMGKAVRVRHGGKPDRRLLLRKGIDHSVLRPERYDPERHPPPGDRTSLAGQPRRICVAVMAPVRRKHAFKRQLTPRGRRTVQPEQIGGDRHARLPDRAVRAAVAEGRSASVRQQADARLIESVSRALDHRPCLAEIAGAAEGLASPRTD